MSRAQEKPTDKTVKELTDLDPFVDMVSGCCFSGSAHGLLKYNVSFIWAVSFL